MSTVDRHPSIVESPVLAQHTIRWDTEDATRAFAQRWAQCPALHNAFIRLQGDLGAGKTTLVRHLLQALGVQGRIKSPTYAVVEPYTVADRDIWHFDFYRFSDPQEWEDAGFRDIFASTGLKLAEWPEKVGALLPVADLEMQLSTVNESARQVTFIAHTPAGLRLMEAAISGAALA